MACFRCGRSSGSFSGASSGASSRSSFGAGPRGMKRLRALSRSAAKYAGAKLREAGQLPVSAAEPLRLAVCRGCPLRTLVDGQAYCGRPLWARDDALAPLSGPHPTHAGCGCPLRDKARDPAEHCPRLTPRTDVTGDGCLCQWCTAERVSPRE